MSLFAFVQREWSAVYDASSKVAATAHSSPRTDCFYARRASLAELDALFASLQHRTFRREL